MTDQVLVQCMDGIATVTMNRPDKLNALTTAGFVELTVKLRQPALDDAAAVVIIAGAGRAFCARGEACGGSANCVPVREAQFERGRNAEPRGGHGSGSLAPHALRHDGRPFGGSARVCRKTQSRVQRSMMMRMPDWRW